VHLDLASRSLSHQAEIVDRLRARGATPADIGQRDVPWVVLADPEGNELCVLEPRADYGGAEAGTLAAVVVDAHAPRQLGGFWAAASGWELSGEVDSEETVRLVGPGGAAPFLELVAAPDAKVTKNRVHLDVAPFADDDRDREVARLVSLGATPVDVGQGPDVSWVVLADPEGNEFCVLRPR
jgi:predicted enzyme related to lactoylglutathione lyase